MLRRLTLVLAVLSMGAQAAWAEADPMLFRWGQPADAIAVEDDPAAPFVSFFTPAYQDDERIATWSMMAAKWRASGEVGLSVGVRLVHDDSAPWTIESARLPDGSRLMVDSFAPLRTCDQDGACVQRETAAITLSRRALEIGATSGLTITLVTASGADRQIAFPQDILAQLYRGAVLAP